MDPTATQEDLEVFSRINPIRLAWGVILIAFSVFCVTCVASVVGIHYFFFQSSLSLEVTLQVGRGTVGIKAPNAAEQAESGTRVLSSGTIIRTDQTDIWSQAILSLRDPNYNDSLVALITLRADTSVQLRSSSRPRFRWSSTDYFTALEVSGKIDVFIPDDLNRDIQFVVLTSGGAEIRLLGSGRYTIDVSNALVQITNCNGRAVLIPVGGQGGQSVSEEQRGILHTEDSTIELAPALVDLVTNSDLEPFAPSNADEPGYVPDRLVGWSCTYTPPNNPPRGSYRADVSPDGRPSFRLVRGEGADTNGRTLCEQTFGPTQNGVDVSTYDYLSVQATLYIHYQSLSRCGTQASECPLMLLVEFEDVNGNSRTWIHGIYARDDPGAATEYRFRCDSCFDNHVRIYDNVWYTYRSENLVDVFPESRPAKITKLVFYAEGHQYDVFIDAVALLAGHLQNRTNENGNDVGE